MTGTHAHTNRLAAESSPYLLQHAHNPVDWFPWGEEAFAEARRRDVPIFLSVGYATCYWCHVMERESFEDPRTAALMNDRFVCVKVDREERPDVDELSMAATVTLTGRGGWPTSVFLEPQGLRPYFAGTYFPSEERHGIPAFTRVLEALSNAWRDRRQEVLQQAESLAAAVRDQLGASPDPVPLGPAHAQKAVATLLQIFDRADGGFGGAPKFPQPVFLEFLLDARQRADDATRDAIDAAARTTLDRMAIGGIHDHLAGGFHRYSVDKHWTVPHFEKMLYDNAQLAAVYARAAAAYHDPFYLDIARRTCDYVLREMTDDPDAPGTHGFFSAQDAEVDHREGLNYLWTPADFDRVLDPDDAAFAKRIYNLDASPNFQDPHHPNDDPAWVLRTDARPEDLADRLNTSPEAFAERIARINAALFAERATRKQPITDDKVLTAWNALMITGLVATAEAINARGHGSGDRYLEAARRAARFILSTMRDGTGRLLRSYRSGQAAIPAPLEDHAFLAHALLQLARADRSNRAEWLAAAADTADRARALFADDRGGYFDTEADRPDLFVRARSTHDGATPAPTGMMLLALLDLADQTNESARLDQAIALLAALSGAVVKAPVGTINPLRAMLRMMDDPARLAGRYTFSDAEPEPAPPRQPTPVRVLANTEKVTVTKDTPAVFKIALEPPPGYHIIAADPGPAKVPLTPLRVGLTRGQGVAVYADYPAGDPYGLPEIGTIHVHHDRIEFDVVLEHKPGVGASPGIPVLGVSFQACSDTECLPPRTVELDIAVEFKD
ncbi:MAG: thioredoxin domain-containing protein [Planctomycetota bacterium]|nr:MAG: thioredoxin domain-containing protein [Planctomycetota bacterium]